MLEKQPASREGDSEEGWKLCVCRLPWLYCEGPLKCSNSFSLWLGTVSNCWFRSSVSALQTWPLLALSKGNPGGSWGLWTQGFLRARAPQYPWMLCHLVLRGCYSNQTIPAGRPPKMIPWVASPRVFNRGTDETALFTVGPAPCFLEQWLDMWILHVTHTKALKKIVKCIIQHSLSFLKNADSVIPCLTGKTSSKNCEGRLGHACLHLTPERAHQPLTCGSCICLLRDMPPRGPMEPHYRVLPSHQKPQGGPRTGAGSFVSFL